VRDFKSVASVRSEESYRFTTAATAVLHGVLRLLVGVFSMSDGEYDILGNLLEADAPKEEEKLAPLFVKGDTVDVKEGGNVYRKAVVIKFDEKGQQLCLEYEDGEKESEVPINLIKLGSRVPPAISSASPPGMGGVKAEGVKAEGVAVQPVTTDTAVPAVRKERRTKKSKNPVDKEIISGEVTSFSSKPRQCYELLKTFSEAEQEAAWTMLQALDSIRACKQSTPTEAITEESILPLA